MGRVERATGGGAWEVHKAHERCIVTTKGASSVRRLSDQGACLKIDGEAEAYSMLPSAVKVREVICM